MIGKTTRVLREKLQDCHGDTMVEVLAAVFIAALGATMLATMVTVSGNCFGPKPAGAERLVRRGGFFVRFVCSLPEVFVYDSRL